MESLPKTVSNLREKIGQLSLEILRLLNERTEIALQIAEEKTGAGLPLRDSRREEALLDELLAANQGPLDLETVRSLFRTVLDASVSLGQRGGDKGLRVGAQSGPRVRVSIRGHQLGGDALTYIAGPCAIESEEQLDRTATILAGLGVRFLRGGAFKPRTSPYSFQGLGRPGLEILSAVARRHDMVSVTEATTPAQVELVAAHADIIQIGARNMYNYELLRAAGRSGKAVLLKRAFAATLDEWLHAAEYIALSGSERIILCERGIRTFARETRNTLDLSVVPLAAAQTRLPVIVDVSHAAGRRDILAQLARGAFAVGAQAVMVEVHPRPDVALSDAGQQLTLSQFARLQQRVVGGLRRSAAHLERSFAPGGRAAGADWSENAQKDALEEVHDAA